MRALVERFLTRLAAVERAVSCAAFAVLIIVVFADVLAREITGTGLHWAPQAGVYGNVVVVMLGLGMASAGGTHLRPRFADNWLPATAAPYLELANDLGMALFCLAYAAVAVGVVAESFALQERSVALQIAVWPFQAVVPTAFLIAGVRHLAYAAYPHLRPRTLGALVADVEERGGA